ncbi:hypothetical protein ACQJBY_021223 [Aegilops geniculata]|uniref:uncharacterized protein n=1 Tax=Triticum aestivum TaxID=4565 RepID=UPI001D034D51|nr:uncharacterized protein LOC123074076 [Triticum aestivum]
MSFIFSDLNFLAAASGLGGSVLHGRVKLTTLKPREITEQRLIKRGDSVVAQAKARWTVFPSLSTWEDTEDLKLNFPDLVVPHSVMEQPILALGRQAECSYPWWAISAL